MASTAWRILIINGPNLNLLGSREPQVYGTLTLEQINENLRKAFPHITLEFFQSNHEGGIIDRLQQAPAAFQGVVLNPGALTHYSYSIRDTVKAIDIPVVEVHISNIFAREDFRGTSVIAPVCQGTVSGFGWRGYLLAIQGVLNILEQD